MPLARRPCEFGDAIMMATTTNTAPRDAYAAIIVRSVTPIAGRRQRRGRYHAGRHGII